MVRCQRCNSRSVELEISIRSMPWCKVLSGNRVLGMEMDMLFYVQSESFQGSPVYFSYGRGCYIVVGRSQLLVPCNQKGQGRDGCFYLVKHG
jgi:hypothetical protein